LLNHPYDDELKAVTGPFGTLLRAMITTVDLRWTPLSRPKKCFP